MFCAPNLSLRFVTVFDQFLGFILPPSFLGSKLWRFAFPGSATDGGKHDKGKRGEREKENDESHQSRLRRRRRKKEKNFPRPPITAENERKVAEMAANLQQRNSPFLHWIILRRLATSFFITRNIYYFSFCIRKTFHIMSSCHVDYFE